MARRPLLPPTILPPLSAAPTEPQLLDSLAFLHENGITHADVKPENICMTSPSTRQVCP